MPYYPYEVPPQGGGYYQQQPPAGQYPPQQQQGGYPQQPYGAPPPQQQQPYGAPPQQQPYGAPPPQQYGAPPAAPYGAPPQHAQYGAPAPAPYGAPAAAPYGAPAAAPYGAPPAAPYGAPPPAAPYGQQPAPYGQQQQRPPYGAPLAAAGYGAAPAGYPGGSYGAPRVMPTPPSLGYGAPQMIAWDATHDANGLRQAMKGFGTDEKALIRILADKDPLQMDALRSAYQRLHRRDLISDIQHETSSWFEYGLVSLARGPLLNDVYMLNDALDGPGTAEWVLNDVLLGRSNADMQAIKSLYHQKFHRSLEDAVRSDLSMKTERHFMIVLQATRTEDAAPVQKHEVDRDVQELYNATEGKLGTDEIRVCSILSTRNDNHIRAIAVEYQQRYARPLEDVIRREFSGHMEDALLCQLHHATDRYMHQAVQLENAMAGMGTKDKMLISRVVRAHWDRTNLANVRGAYEKRYRRTLASRIRGETSGDYERLMLACVGA